MLSRTSHNWLRLTYISQLLTAALHSLSFLKKPQPTNETEKQLIDLMTTYEQPLGGGFSPTMMDLFTSLSACMTLLCLLSGLTLWYLVKQQIGAKTLKGLMSIYMLVFGIGFMVMLFLTFLPPIICFGLIFTGAAGSYFALGKLVGQP